MSVIVGYMSARPGPARHSKRGIAEAKLRSTDLVVVHSLHGAGSG